MTEPRGWVGARISVSEYDPKKEEESRLNPNIKKVKTARELVKASKQSLLYEIKNDGRSFKSESPPNPELSPDYKNYKPRENLLGVYTFLKDEFIKDQIEFEEMQPDQLKKYATSRSAPENKDEDACVEAMIKLVLRMVRPNDVTTVTSLVFS
eukprot:1189927-Prorocentrum_minimum.AAC.5